jgi:hypothetical protein
LTQNPLGIAAFLFVKLRSGIIVPTGRIGGDTEPMRKLPSTLFVFLASIVLASAEPWTVIRVYSNSFVVRSTITPPDAMHPHGTSRIEHFSVTPATKFFVNGNKGSFADLKSGVHVNVESHSGTKADRVEIVP